MKCTPKLNDRKYQVDIKLNYTLPISQLQKKIPKTSGGTPTYS